MQGRDRFLFIPPAFRAQLLALSAAQDQAERDRLDSKTETTHESSVLEAVQKELMTEAYMRNDPDLKIENGYLVASIEDYMEPIKVAMSEIEAAVVKKGQGSFRRLPLAMSPTGSDVRAVRTSLNTAPSLASGDAYERRGAIKLEDTICMSLWIVRPQHCQSAVFFRLSAQLKWSCMNRQLKIDFIWGNFNAMD